MHRMLNQQRDTSILIRKPSKETRAVKIGLFDTIRDPTAFSYQFSVGLWHDSVLIIYNHVKCLRAIFEHYTLF